MTRAHAKTTSSVPTPATRPPLPPPLEAKLVVLGAQGVGKTSLVHRFMSPVAAVPVPRSSNATSSSSSSSAAGLPSAPPSTIGASFHTKRVLDPDTSTTVRLQIWDTAGQERFRSISRLYYRGAHAGLLCYDITNEASWEQMKGWIRELKAQCGDAGPEGLVIHVVGTKSDIVADDPSRRQVPFERTVAYVAEQLQPHSAATPPPTAMTTTSDQLLSTSAAGAMSSMLATPISKRSSGFWAQDAGWDSCHEVNARDGEGVEEVFRVIARKLVEQRTRRLEREEREQLASMSLRSLGNGPGGGSSTGVLGPDHHYYPFSSSHRNSTITSSPYTRSRFPSRVSIDNGNGSFRLGGVRGRRGSRSSGIGDDGGDSGGGGGGGSGENRRKSWLGLPAGLSIPETGERIYEPHGEAKRNGRCC